MIRYLPYQSYNGTTNMAIDHYFYNTKETILRFYGWKPSALSFGKSNRELSDIDLNFCKENNIELVGRMTGGKTVFHQNELTYCFCGDGTFFPKSVIETYKQISSLIAMALENIGIKSDMKPEKELINDSNICFHEKSSYELTVNGKKLIGSAQKRSKKRVLQHGSILIKNDFDIWKKIWPNSDVESIRKRVTSIQEISKNKVDLTSLTEKIVEQFEKYFQESIRERTITVGEWEEIRKTEEKFKFN